MSATTHGSMSKVEFHRGEVLMKLANTYTRLPQTLQECIQNGFDAGADRILVCIDMSRREVIILDNGLGTDREKFEVALASVGHSVKDANSLGRFGLGLISPLSKCTSFTFTSTSATQRRPLRWTFKAADIRKQRHSTDIPCEELDQMPRLPRKFAEYASGEFDTMYRTMLRMSGVTMDRAIGSIDIDQLAYDIRTKFVGPMRKRKALVRLVFFDVNGRLQTQDVDPLEYSGEPLAVTRYEAPDVGWVEFEIYKARRTSGQRTGGDVSVTTMAGDTPITWAQFTNQMRGRVGSMNSGAIEVLSSGYFEGVIRGENLQLTTSRTKFELGDALDMLYLVIDQWYDECGRLQYASEADRSRQARWQNSGLKVLSTFQERLHLPKYATLWQSLIDVVELGRLGGGHLDPEAGEPDGNDSERSTRVGQGGVDVKRKKNPTADGGDNTRRRPPKDRPGDLPLTASGPRGNKRRLVKGDSKGLQLDYAELAGDSRLWGFDFTDGTITFNTLHPIWVKLDESNGKHLAKNAKWITLLQEWLTLQVLHLVVHYPDVDEFELRRDFVDEQIEHHVDMFIVG